MNKYSFSDHLHNYAVWTAARAVSRNFTNTKNINKAIEEAKLQELIKNPNKYSTEIKFNKFHNKSAKIIIKSLIKNLKGNSRKKATYGRAAKIIAIYIKTTCVIRSSGHYKIAKVAHPPIDSFLLKKISLARRIDLNEYKWTQLDEKKYKELIVKLRRVEKSIFWKTEKYWSPLTDTK